MDIEFTSVLPIKPDEPTRNGRIYPRAVVEKMVDEMREQISKNVCFGEVVDDGCATPALNLSKVGFCVTDVSLINDTWSIQGKWLDTPATAFLKNAISSGYTIGFTPSMMGTVESDGRITDAQFLHMSVYLHPSHMSE
jgi:hypothetical protein